MYNNSYIYNVLFKIDLGRTPLKNNPPRYVQGNRRADRLPAGSFFLIM